METRIRIRRSKRARLFLYGAIVAIFVMSYVRLFLWAVQHGLK